MAPARPPLSVGLQLHMTAEDVDEIVAELQGKCEFGYFATKDRFSPFLPADGPVTSRPGITMLKCTLHPWARREDDFDRFLDANPGLLSIEVPRVRDVGLVEVMISSKVFDAAHADRIKAWAKFLRRYRRRLQSGAFVTSVRTGAGAYYRNAHATVRALAAARAGTPLVGPNGGTRFEYGPAPGISRPDE
jgi:hypothetical protein